MEIEMGLIRLRPSISFWLRYGDGLCDVSRTKEWHNKKWRALILIKLVNCHLKFT